MEEEKRVYYQECGGVLLNVYRYTEDEDEMDLGVGQKINDPAEHHVEGTLHTTLRRVK